LQPVRQCNSHCAPKYCLFTFRLCLRPVLYCTVMCCAVLCCTVLCCALLCFAKLCCAVRCGAVRCGVVLCGAVRCGAVLFCALLCGGRCLESRCTTTYTPAHTTVTTATPPSLPRLLCYATADSAALSEIGPALFSDAPASLRISPPFLHAHACS